MKYQFKLSDELILLTFYFQLRPSPAEGTSKSVCKAVLSSLREAVERVSREEDFALTEAVCRSLVSKRIFAKKG